MGGKCGDRGFRERKKDENEPRNIVVRFVTHRRGICPPRLLRHRRRCVVPPLPPPPRRRLAPHLTLSQSRPCFSSSSLCHPPDSPVVDVVASALVAVWVSPVFVPPRILRRARLTAHIPLERGGANWAATSLVREPRGC